MFNVGRFTPVFMDLMRKANVLVYGQLLYKPSLLGVRTLLTGTVRGNSKGLPLLPTKMNIGEMISYRRQGILLVARKSRNGSRC